MQYSPSRVELLLTTCCPSTAGQTFTTGTGLCSPKHTYINVFDTYRPNCEATFNKDGELIKVELL